MPPRVLRLRGRRATALAGVVLTAAVVAGQTDEGAERVRLGRYVDEWEVALGSVVADEHYVQTVARQPRSELSRQVLVPARESRALRSEFTLVRLDGPTEWVGFRRVLSVDGTAVTTGGPTLDELMRDPRLSWRQRWERVRELSAAHNIGATARTVNVPTFAFAAIRSNGQPRFRFTTRRPETLDGRTVGVLEFRERARPTLVSGLDGRDVPLSGRVWFEPASGRVHRTVVELRDHIATPSDGDGERARDQELASRITVRFAPDTNVGAWVPVEMQERYDNSWGELTTGRATYGNHRRFRTSVRMLRQDE